MLHNEKIQTVMKISGMRFLVKGERSLLSSWGWGEDVPVIKQQLWLVKGRNLNPGFPCLYVVLLGFIFNFFWSSSQFKKTVFLPSTMYNVISLLGKFCLRTLFQDLNFSLAECLLFACVLFTSQFRLLCVSDLFF